jgi:hypothetical protein
MYEAIELHDKCSLAENKLEPKILIPLRKGIIRLRSADEINLDHFDLACSEILIRHETDGLTCALLASRITELPVGNRVDLAESEFRGAIFQETYDEIALVTAKGDYRKLKFIGEDNSQIDTVVCPLGNFIFEACLKGTYTETPPREGLPSNLNATFCLYKNDTDPDKYFIILEIANLENLAGGLIHIYTARSIPTIDIK